MRRYIESINPFVSISIFYIISVFIVRSVELATSFSDIEINNISAFLYDNILSAFSISLISFIIYNITSFFSRKTALIICSFFFASTLIAETGLVIYRKMTGLMMGREIIERPLWETLHTIKSVSDIWMIIAVIVLIIIYVFISIKISKKEIHKRTSVTVLLLMLTAGISSLFINPSNDKVTANKLRHCLNECLSYDKPSIFNESSMSGLYKINFDENHIEAYKRIFPYRNVVDETYPLEREDNVKNVLGEYFKKSNVRPNIVLVIMESLGSDMFGFNEYGFSATPFLDSLACHSLVWNNCLSTTPRSSGAVPAITASPPHGIKGFQFGNIPNHNSLFSILKENGYTTNAFYGSWFSFDRIYDYLMAQEIDYMSPFSDECNRNKDDSNYECSSWGYHDGTMFEESMKVIRKRDKGNPHFDMFITISQHDNKLELNNKKKQEYYYSKAEKLLSSLSGDEYKNLKNKKGFIAAFLYGDDCLKQFFHSYNNHLQDNNTIFIITGDHSLNLNPQNPLNAYHVPLIIWSPSIVKTKCFSSLVSHNDITPSMTALLRDNFNIKTPQHVHWVSDGLDTSSSFNCNIKSYFMNANNKVNDYIYDNYFYNKDEKKLYLICDSLKVRNIDDNSVADEIEDFSNTILYIDRYSYLNDRITRHPIISRNKYVLIDSVSIDSVLCISGKEKPSISKPKHFMIHSEKIDSKYSDIKVIFTADIKYTADVSHEQFMDVNIKSSKNIWWPDKISKNIIGYELTPGKWMDMEITKSFHNNNKRDKIYIYVSPTEHDSNWNPEHTIILKNIKITILGTINDEAL